MIKYTHTYIHTHTSKHALTATEWIQTFGPDLLNSKIGIQPSRYSLCEKDTERKKCDRGARTMKKKSTNTHTYTSTLQTR